MVGKTIRDLVEIHGKLFALWGGSDHTAVAQWLSRPNYFFGGETPLERMLKDAKGVQDVLEHLRSLTEPVSPLSAEQFHAETVNADG